jgi:signal transduction histidine kinase
LTSGTREIFGRAARVLRESLDVEGVVFYDASVKSYAGLVRNSDDRPSDGESSSGSSEAQSSSDSENPANGHSSTETDDFNMSDVLGFSLQDPEQPMGAIRETFLRSLLRNYPQGAIFNIDENGGVSSSEGSDSASSTSVSREIFYRRHEGPKTQRKWKQRKRHRVSLKEENKALMKVFPSARCVTLFPLWDSRRNRWFSGLFVWTKSPRVFSLGGELAYLYAFSNNIMAEIHRLDMELANRAHATLVGSISHELRSPLHGILGSTELLGDSALTPAQTALVNTVEHCGRSLLDIINNMLDFAKINQFTRKSRSSRLKFSRPTRRMTANGNGLSSGPKGQPNDGIVNLIGDVQLDAVLEEVADSVFAGHCFSSKASGLAQGATSMPTLNQDGELVMASPTERPLSAFNESLTVVYDVAPDVQWLFETQAGAWRRVLMNLFGNALKYTQSGYIHVSLKSSTPSTTPGNRRLSRCESDREEPATVTLTVKDTGQGIDKEYLQSNIFKPFSQEDPLSPGSGLGLSIVHQTVVSLGGKIDISSTKGVGTEVTVHCGLSRTPNAEVTSDDQGRGIVQEAKELVRGKSIGLVGFEAPSEKNDQALELLRSSLTRTYQGHFGMKVRFVYPETIGEPCDMYVARQTYMDEADEICRRVTAAAVAAGKSPISPPIIVICSTPQVAQKLSTSASPRASRSVHEFISQPCGPSKMANTLRACINRQKEQANQPPAKTNGVHEPKPAKNILPLSLPATPLRNDATGAHADICVSPIKAAASITTSTLDSGPITEISATLEPVPIVPSVLLVDDNTVNLQLLVAVMKKAKFPHFTACNGLEALEVYKAHSREIHVILMGKPFPPPYFPSLQPLLQMHQLTQDRGQTSQCQ